MATSLSIESKRIEGFAVNPRDLVVVQGDNGRIKPHNDLSIAQLAASFKTNGQIHPVGIAKLPNGTVKLVYGYRRWAASMLLNEGKLPTDADWMPLKATIVKGNDSDQYLANLAENIHHSGLTHMDIAYNVGRLRDKMQWKDKQIAEFFGKTPAWVSQHASLLNLVDEWRDRVDSGEVAMVDAMAISRMSYEEQRAKLGIVNDTIAELAKEEEFSFLNDEPDTTMATIIANANGSDGNQDSPKITPIEAKIKENAEKKKADKRKMVTKRVAAEAIGNSKKAPVLAAASRVQVNQNGKRSWGALMELFEMVGPAYSKRLQTLSDLMRKGMMGDDNFRDDHVFLATLERLLDDASIESMAKLMNTKTAAVVS